MEFCNMLHVDDQSDRDFDFFFGLLIPHLCNQPRDPSLWFLHLLFSGSLILINVRIINREKTRFEIVTSALIN